MAKYQGKSMTATFYSLKAEDSALGKEFWAAIQSESNPSEVWAQYVAGNAPKDITKKLDSILINHKGTGAWTKPVSAKKLAKMAEKDELQKAEDNLADLKKKLDVLDNKTYQGIWKDDVNLSDYESKKGSIDAKKQYYNDQIDKLIQDKNAGLIDETTANLKMNEFYDKLQKVAEFEVKGKEYADAYNKYADAKKEVNKLKLAQGGGPFDADAYTKDRKDNAVWAKSPKQADDVLRDAAGELWRDATRQQQLAIYEYTKSYHKFNEPLRGYEYGSNEYKGVGNTDLNAKYANNGSTLNEMTDLLEKARLPQDQWFQRGCRFSGMDKFFNCSDNLLRNGSQAELEKELLGKTITEYGFMSMGSSKGQGFGGDILINIYAPSGTKAMYVEPISAYGDGDRLNWDGYSKQRSFGSELETILQQNTDFKITKIERKSNTIYFDLEVIAQNEPQRWKK